MSELTEISLDALHVLDNATKLAEQLGIETLLIKDGSVRALSQNQTVAIITHDVVGYDLPTTALTRIGIFQKRLQLANFLQATVGGMAEVDDRGYVRSITFKHKRTKIEYRCSNPAVVSAPSALNDKPVYSFELTGETVDILNKAIGATDATKGTVTFIGNEEGLFFKVSDTNNDSVEYQIAESVNTLKNVKKVDFSTVLPAITLKTLFSLEREGVVKICDSGTMIYSVMDLTVYVLPQG